MSRLGLVSGITLALLLATGVLLAVPMERGDAARSPRFEMMAPTLDGWTRSPVAPDERMLPVPDTIRHHFGSTYVRDGRRLAVSVGYVPAQGEGNRPPFAEMLFPNRGWAGISEESFTLTDTAGRPLRLRSRITGTGASRQAMLYWYQLGTRTVDQSSLYRGLLVWNRIVHGRTDAALVRIAMPPVTDGIDTTATRLTSFARAFAPELARALPDE